jgi:signal transduction histidine kinase/tetratricopeptide (TPR) repeat protein
MHFPSLHRNGLNHVIKSLLAVICVLYLVHPSIAQSYTRNDSVQIYALLNQADEEALTGSLDTAMVYARHALQVSKGKKMLRGEGFAHLKIADILVQQESPGDLIAFFTEGLEIGARLKDSFMMALACYQQGEYLMYKDQLEEAEKLFNRSLTLKFAKEQSNHTALVYNDLGYMYGLKDDLEKQVEWYLKAIRLYEKTTDVHGLASTTSSLAAVYAKLGNTPKALEFTRKAIAMRQNTGDIKGLANSYENLSRLYWGVSHDSASKYQQLAMQHAEKSGVKSLMIRSYDNLSVLMNMQKNKPEALAYIKRSIVLCREINDKAGLASKCRWAALLCADMKDTITMETYYRESYELSVQLNNKTLLRDLYGTKAGYYSRVNDFKNAYDNLKKYYSYRDSIVSAETATNIAELQTRYDTEKKDNEISRLNTDQKIKQLEIERQKAIISGNRLEAKEKENAIKLLSQQQELRDIRIRQQREELEKQFLVSENNQKALQLAATEKILKDKELLNQKRIRNLVVASMLLLIILTLVVFNRFQLKKKLQQQAALEKMRVNIASDLHDDIGASLSNINILNELARRNQGNASKSNEYLTKAGEDIQHISESLGDIVWNINPRYDDLQNLFVRMKRYASDMMDGKGISYEMRFPEEADKLSLSMERRRDFYLIFKEAVNNLARYSKATAAKVIVEADRKKVCMTVSDNGIGFNIDQAPPGNGIHNMRQRAALRNDLLHIHSEPGKGTTIILEMHTT